MFGTNKLSTKSINTADVFGVGKTMRDHIKNGVSYKSIGGVRNGLAAAQDSGMIYDHLEKQEMNAGGGMHCFKLYDIKGENELVNQPMPFNGKTYYPDSKGLFRVFDEAYLALERKREEEHQNAIDEVLENVVVSDSMAQTLLGEDAFKKFLKGGTDNKDEDVDCRPSRIAALAKGSHAYSLAISKMRAIISEMEALPIIERSTSQTLVNNPE